MLDTTKISALAMLLIVAGLILNLAINSDRGEEIDIDSPTPARSKTLPTATREREPGSETGLTTLDREWATVQGTKRTMPAEVKLDTTEETGNWTMTLYPELARIAALESQPGDIALASLLPMLSDADPVVRLAALESLADLGRQAPLTAVTAALADPNPQIRAAALDALAIRRDSSAVASIEVLVYDRDTQVRAAAIDALAVIGERSSAHTLGALLGDPNQAIKRSAVGALGEIGGDIAIGYLQQARFDPDDSIRESARAILREEGTGID